MDKAPIKAIIIDDEVHCIDTLSILLADYCPEVEVVTPIAEPLTITEMPESPFPIPSVTFPVTV